MGQAAGLVGGQVAARESRRGGLGQRDDLEPVGQLLQGSRDLKAVTADPGPAQAGEVAAGAERGAEVAGQAADVGTARAADGHVDVELVTGRARGRHGELVDGDRPGGQLRRGARPGQPVGALAADLDRADRGRYLDDVPGQGPYRRGQGRPGDAGGRRGRGDLALGIVGAGGLAEPDRAVVALLGHGEVAEQPGGLLHSDHQDAGSHRVQGPGVPHPPGAGQPPDPRYHVVRGHAAGLVHDDQAAGLRSGHSPSSPSSPSSSSSSHSASAGLR